MIADKLTLKLKISLGVIIASALSVILASVIYVNIEDGRLKESMQREMQTLTEVVSRNSAGTLAFQDVDSATEVLAALEANSHIIGAVLYNDKGKPFAAYQRGREAGDEGLIMPPGFPGSAPAAGISYTEEYLQSSYQIEDMGSTIGTLYLRVDLTELEGVESSFIGTASLIVLGAVIFSIVLSFFIQKSVVTPISAVVSALRDIADGEGDLTQRLSVSSKDELGELANCFNHFVEKIHGVVTGFRESADNVANQASSLSDTTEQTSQGVIRQQSEIALVASAINEMSSTVQEVARNVNSAAEDAELADNHANQGKTIVQQTMQSIEELAGEIERAAVVITELQKESDNIGAVLEVIGGIAEQTNLLALNAAIEAARAGEQGRGFAVVADEVRTLASRTQSSTQEIQEMIDRLQTGAQQAVKVMEQGRQAASDSCDKAEEANAALDNITHSVSVIRDMTQQIASASEEQSSVTNEINQNILNISQVANQTADDAKLIDDGSGSLANHANTLQGLISQFKL